MLRSGSLVNGHASHSTMCCVLMCSSALLHNSATLRSRFVAITWAWVIYEHDFQIALLHALPVGTGSLDSS